MDDWLDALNNQDKDKNSSKPELRALDGANESTKAEEDVADKQPEQPVEEQPQPKKKPKAVKKPKLSRPARNENKENAPSEPKKRGSAVPIALGVAILALVGIGATTYLNQGSDSPETTEAQGETEQSSPVADQVEQKGPQPISDTSKEVAEVGDRCGGNNDVDVSQEDSPRAAIAKFEKAYFDADANGVKASLTKDSEMQKQDWMKILPKAAPEGTTWCLTMQPSEGDTTSVELEVKQPKEDKPTLYKQKVTAKDNHGTWAVHSIGRED